MKKVFGLFICIILVLMMIGAVNYFMWVNSDGGIVATIGSDSYKEAGIDCNTNGAVDVKWKPGSNKTIMIYRCSTLPSNSAAIVWPFYNVRESAQTAKFIQNLSLCKRLKN